MRIMAIWHKQGQDDLSHLVLFLRFFTFVSYIFISISQKNATGIKQCNSVNNYLFLFFSKLDFEVEPKAKFKETTEHF